MCVGSKGVYFFFIFRGGGVTGMRRVERCHVLVGGEGWQVWAEIMWWVLGCSEVPGVYTGAWRGVR